MRFIAYKFLRLIEDGFEVEYSIFTIEEMYECYWNDLRYFLTFNNYFKDDKITDEGYDFLNTHPLHFWEKYQMTIVDYSDFEEDEEQDEKSKALYLMFVKCMEEKLHYVV